MKNKKIIVLLITVLLLCGCNKKESNKEEKIDANEKVTEIKDISLETDYNPTNNWIKNNDYLNVLSDKSEYYVVKKDNNIFYIDNKGNKVITLDSKYDYAYGFYGDIAMIESGDDISLIDKTGKVVVNSNNNNWYRDNYGLCIVNGILYYNTTEPKNNNDIEVYPFKQDIDSDNYITSSGIFGFYDKSKKTTGVINAEGKKLFEIKSQNKLELAYDEDLAYDFHQFQSRYCVVGIDDKSGVINCDNGLVIHDLSDTYKYKISLYNFIEVYNGNDFVKEEYIYQDKIAKEFDYKVHKQTTEYRNAIFIAKEEEDLEYYDNLDSMLLNGTIVPDDDSNIVYNDYLKANYILGILGKKFKVVATMHVIDTPYEFSQDILYGVKKNDKLVIPIEYSQLLFNIDNEDYAIGYNNKNSKEEYFLYDLNNASKTSIKSDDMGFVNSYTIYYDKNDKRMLYNLNTKKEIEIEKDKMMGKSENFIKVNDKIYNKDYEVIWED